jgi:hypothetical protein
MPISLVPQQNESGDALLAAQGFGRLSEEPAPTFSADADTKAVATFFAEYGYAVIDRALTPIEINTLNTFFDVTQQQHPELWGLGAKRKPHHRNQGLILSQPLLDFPELDVFLQHPIAYRQVEALLGGPDAVRWAEFNFRETPQGSGVGTMNFHHDAVVEDRFLRSPHNPPDYLCTIHYLTDVTPDTPAFCVVPGSQRYPTLRAAYEHQGQDYIEQPIYGSAGTCVLYDTALFHTRLDGDGNQPRRTWHQYYARGGHIKSRLPTTDRYVRSPSPVLTDWNLIPERLALHEDPRLRLFFSHWNSAQGEWVAQNFDPLVRAAMPRGNS